MAANTKKSTTVEKSVKHSSPSTDRRTVAEIPPVKSTIKLQVGRCKDRKGRSASSLPSETHCVVCDHPEDFHGEPCRFRAQRLLGDGPELFFFDPALEWPFPPYHRKFSEAITPQTLAAFQEGLCRALVPVIDHALKHSERGGIMKNIDSTSRDICDSCSASIFIVSYICFSCHYEICPMCIETSSPHNKILGCKYPNDSHKWPGKHQLISVSRMPWQKLANTRDEIRGILSNSARDACASSDTYTDDVTSLLEAARVMRTVPAIEGHNIDIFRNLWAAGLPMVVDVSHKISFELWTPSVFMKNHESETVRIIKQTQEDLEEVTGTLQHFMQLFEMSDEERGYVVKLKDYPPSQSFDKLYHDHYQDFQDALPFPSYTSATGFHNLAAHHPGSRNTSTPISTMPDLGPKLYFAPADRVVDEEVIANRGRLAVPVPGSDNVETKDDSTAVPSQNRSDNVEIMDDLTDIPLSTVSDKHRVGSTRLHMDMSGAVNVMVTDLSGKGSVWTIFAEEDTDSIRRYLRRKYELGSTSPCPIHSQQYYLRQADLRELFLAEGVIPYIFTQKKGQAVFIPVGCAHQVSNNGACIKIATDFVTVSQALTNWKLTKEFHFEGIEDVLGLPTVLLHAWFSAKELCNILPSSIPDGPDSGAGPLSKKRNSPYSNDSHNPRNTKQARKKSRRINHKYDGIQRDESQMHHCPDPGCTALHDRERLYSWHGLYKHIVNGHSRIMPSLQIWKEYKSVSSTAWRAWYIRRLRKQALEKAITDNL